MTKQHIIQAFEQLFRLNSRSQLQHHAARLQSEQAVSIMERFDEFKAQLIAQAHRRYQSSYAALFNSSSSSNLACFHSLVYSRQVLLQRSEVQHLCIVAWAGQEDNLIACCLEISRNSLVAVDNANCKGYERRRNSFIHKGTAHAVLAADCRQIKRIERRKCT